MFFFCATMESFYLRIGLSNIACASLEKRTKHATVNLGSCAIDNNFGENISMCSARNGLISRDSFDMLFDGVKVEQYI